MHVQSIHGSWVAMPGAFSVPCSAGITYWVQQQRSGNELTTSFYKDAQFQTLVGTTGPMEVPTESQQLALKFWEMTYHNGQGGSKSVDVEASDLQLWNNAPVKVTTAAPTTTTTTSPSIPMADLPTSFTVTKGSFYRDGMHKSGTGTNSARPTYRASIFDGSLASRCGTLDYYRNEGGVWQMNWDDAVEYPVTVLYGLGAYAGGTITLKISTSLKGVWTSASTVTTAGGSNGYENAMRALYVTKAFDGLRFDMSASSSSQPHHTVYEVFPTGVNAAMDAQVARAVAGDGLTYRGGYPCTLKNARDLGYPTGNSFWPQDGGFSDLPLALRTWFSNAEHCGPNCGDNRCATGMEWVGGKAGCVATDLDELAGGGLQPNYFVCAERGSYDNKLW